MVMVKTARLPRYSTIVLEIVMIKETRNVSYWWEMVRNALRETPEKFINVGRSWSLHYTSQPCVGNAAPPSFINCFFWQTLYNFCKLTDLRRTHACREVSISISIIEEYGFGLLVYSANTIDCHLRCDWRNFLKHFKLLGWTNSVIMIDFPSRFSSFFFPVYTPSRNKEK